MSQRIRQIKPDYFSDPDVARLPIRARLTYIGLWTVADDSGWLPRLDAVELGHLLYGYESAKVRERWVVEDLISLQANGRLEVEPCGHGCIPTLSRYQRVSKDRRVEMHWKAHETQCRSAVIPGLPPHSAEFPTGTERNVTGRNGSAGTLKSEFQENVARPVIKETPTTLNTPSHLQGSSE